jgi:hypothetical protein
VKDKNKEISVSRTDGVARVGTARASSCRDSDQRKALVGAAKGRDSSSILSNNAKICLMAAMSLLSLHTSSYIVRMCIKLINNLSIDIQSIPDFLEELSYVIDIDGFDSSSSWTSLNENITTCLDSRVYDNLSLSLCAQDFVSRLKLKGETKITVINIYGAYGTHWVANMKLWPFTNIWGDIYDKMLDQKKNYPMTEVIDNELTVSCATYTTRV